MDAQHTPGPWTARGVFITQSRTDGQYVGTVDSCETAPRERRKNCPPLHEAYANAHLIAAAPDLLAALEGLFEHCAMIHKHWGDGANTQEAAAAQEQARAAIAKAGR